MKKLIAYFIILVFWTSNVFSQVQYDVKKVLETKDFTQFKKLSLNLTDRKKNICSHWKSIRDLTYNYKEGIFFFEKSVPIKDKPGNSSVYTYRVRIITTNTEIVFYELTEKKNKKVKGKWEPYFEIIDTFKDEVDYANFKKEFKTIFLTEINEEELFTTDFVYGSNCGIAGMNPSGRININKLIDKKDKSGIIEWLKSTITEKQIYAIDALYQLKNCGIVLTEDELKMVEFVSNKDGSIETCSGCSFYGRGIKEVTEQFEF
ncbi:hypothetical protein HNV08_14295 [Winogradskyella eckloniae]|uniref:hypothetical protein n=1 Tax=Winogradskyella eckloniae TaxID=1089306 RepID=UPI0015671FFE|nr:hypothetical protein [Winogradskyella eckloniae]NRD21225.1 hypothetical protein [Winogradskyella eckloniae]